MPKRILVVDDEHVIADTLGVILRGCGFDVALAYDPKNALEQCEFAVPDLVISDVVMPGMNGVEMAIIIRERYPLCKVLLFSGQATTQDLLEGARRQGHHFELLQKPVHPKDLLARITQEAPTGGAGRDFVSRQEPIPSTGADQVTEVAKECVDKGLQGCGVASHTLGR